MAKSLKQRTIELAALLTNVHTLSALRKSWPLHNCDLCRRNPATGIWATLRRGKLALYRACGGCGLSILPDRYDRVDLLITIEPQEFLN